MQKTLFVLGTVVLVTSTLALATGGPGVRQNQSFDAATTNYVRRDYGVGRPVGINGAFVGLNQGGNVGRRGYVEQNTTAMLGQGGVAWGRGGMSKVSQTGETEGRQSNRVSLSRRGGGVSQSQKSSTSLGQNLHKVGGRGGAAGMNVGVVDLSQGTASRAGIGGQRQTTMIVQGAMVQGGRHSTGYVSQSATVNASQSQNF